MKRFGLLAVIATCLAAIVSPAFATWGGATLDWNYSYGKAYVYPGLATELWVPAGGAANWTTESETFTTPANLGPPPSAYFMFNLNVNAGDTIWVDNVSIKDVATGKEMLTDPGFETGGNGFFPWEIEPGPATGGFTPGEGVGGTQCIKFVGVSTGHTSYSNILQYDSSWGGTGTCALQPNTTYELSYQFKTVVPEPSAFLALFSGLGGMLMLRRRSRAI